MSMYSPGIIYDVALLLMFYNYYPFEEKRLPSPGTLFTTHDARGQASPVSS